MGHWVIKAKRWRWAQDGAFLSPRQLGDGRGRSAGVKSGGSGGDGRLASDQGDEPGAAEAAIARRAHA